MVSVVSEAQVFPLGALDFTWVNIAGASPRTRQESLGRSGQQASAAAATDTALRSPYILHLS